MNKSKLRQSLDIAKKELFPEDEMPSGFRLNMEALHVAPGSTHKPI